MLLMSLVILIAHALLYVMLPSEYIKQKNREADELIEEMKTDLNGLSEEKLLEKAKSYLEAKKRCFVHSAERSYRGHRKEG